MSRSAVRLALFSLIFAAAACDKVALLAPTGSTVTLSVSTTSVASNGTAEVIATVIEAAGTPVHDGTEVTFQASVGRVDPAVVRTQGGIARTTFHANGASGTARVTAFSGGARAENVEVLVGGAAASTVNVRTSPSSVPQTGGRVEVIATVRDVSGNPLPNAQVVFSADNGTLANNSATTDANGEARTSLTTNRQTVVRASVADKEGQTTVSVVAAPTVQLTATPTNPNVGVPVTFTITPGTNANGNPIQNVTFDPGDGSPVRQLGAITSAQTIQHTYTSAGTYTARAVATDIGGQVAESTVAIVVQRSTPTVSISATPTTANVGDPVTFTINSQPAPNGPPIQSVVVTFPDTTTTVPPGQQTIVRPFDTPGTKVVRVRATDAAGTSVEATTTVIIRERAAIEVNVDATDVDPNFTTTCEPLVGYPKTCTISPSFLSPPPATQTTVRVQFTATVTSGSDPVVRYVWNFGDGAQETSNRSTDHVFQRGSLFGPATYTVTVTVTTASGQTGTGRITLAIQ